MSRTVLCRALTSGALILASCAEVDDPSLALDEEASETWDDAGAGVEKGVPPKLIDAALGLMRGSVAMTEASNPVIGVVSAIPEVVYLIQMLNEQDAGLSDRAIEQIAELLDQNRLTDANWRIESKGGELYDAETVYLRYQCVTDNTKPCGTAGVMFNNALSLHSKASSVLRDIYTGTKPLGFAKLQLVPLLAHAATAVVFAHHEIGLAERSLGASKSDLAKRQAKMEEAAATALMALDDAEDLYDEFVRSKFSSVSVSKSRAGCLSPGPRGCGRYRYTYQASVTGPDGNVYKSASRSTESTARSDMDRKIISIKNSYVLAHAKEVFTTEYASARANLREFAGKKYQGIFRFSVAGPIAGMHCTQITEGAEPAAHTWTDNYFCSTRDVGMRWSEAGRVVDINPLRCTNIHEGSDPQPWSDNYLCLPENSPWRFTWSNKGALSSKICTSWNEGRDPHSWSDNYLCVDPR